MKDQHRYAYRVLWSQEDDEYVGLCAEFPSLSFLTGDQAAALEGIVGLVGEVLLDMQQAGEPVPEPLSSRTFSGRFQVRIPPEDHRRLALQAKEQGISMNRLVASKLSA